jgi:hypothetical protein
MACKALLVTLHASECDTLHLNLGLHTHWISQEEPTRRNRVVEFIIPMFLNCSTCFERHIAYYQELKNCNCSLWFYIRF